MLLLFDYEIFHLYKIDTNSHVPTSRLKQMPIILHALEFLKNM